MGSFYCYFFPVRAASISRLIARRLAVLCDLFDFGCTPSVLSRFAISEQYTRILQIIQICYRIWSMKTFSERVVELALMIPEGRVSTYGDIARAAGGGSMASRSITGILGKAYKAGQTNIPFHRIVYANGKAWFDGEHKERRLKLYKQEGIEVDAKGVIKDFQDKLFDFR